MDVVEKYYKVAILLYRFIFLSDQVNGSHYSLDCLIKIFTSVEEKNTLKTSFKEKFCKKMHEFDMCTRINYNVGYTVHKDI